MPTTHVAENTPAQMPDEDVQSDIERQIRQSNDMMVDADIREKQVNTVDSHDMEKAGRSPSDDSNKANQLTMDSFSTNSWHENAADKTRAGADEEMTPATQSTSSGANDAVKFLVQIYQPTPRSEAQKGDIEYRCVEFTHHGGDEKAYRHVQQKLQAMLNL